MDRRCPQPDWDAAVEQFSLLFFLWLLSDKKGAENSQNLHQIVELIGRIEGLLQALHCRSRLFARESSKYVLFVEAKVPASTSKSTLSKCSLHEPRAARLTHTLSLFCFCGQNTSKMSHGVNKSCITQHVVAQGGYASEVARNSQSTA